MCVCTLCELRGGQYIVTSSTYYNTLYFLEQLYNVQERATHVAHSRRAHMSYPSIHDKSQNKDGSSTEHFRFPARVSSGSRRPMSYRFYRPQVNRATPPSTWHTAQKSAVNILTKLRHDSSFYTFNAPGSCNIAFDEGSRTSSSSRRHRQVRTHGSSL